MSTTVTGPNITKISTNDLSAKQYFIVKLDTDQNKVVLAAAATDNILGVLQNKPKAGENADVIGRWGGGTGKVKTGGAGSAGDHLTSDGNGKAIATTSGGDEVFGRALKDFASGDVVEYAPVNFKYRTS